MENKKTLFSYFLYNLHMRILGKTFCFLANVTTVVGCATLCSCTKEGHHEPIIDDFNITLLGNNYGFSNNLLNDTPYIELPFSINGTIKKGDKLLLNIELTDTEARIGLNDNSRIIDLTEESESINVRIEKSQWTDNIFFEQQFKINFKLWRNYDVIYQTMSDTLYFYNATPVSRELLDIQNDPESHKVTLYGFVDDEITFQQLQWCNFLWIPNDIEVIDSNAFYRYDHSTIPTNNEWTLCLDSNFGGETNSSSLEYIGAQAFDSAQSFTGDIIIPPTVQNIGYRAFAGTGFNGKLSMSDNTKMTYIPSECFKGSDIFKIEQWPSNLYSIQQEAFSNCSSLFEVAYFPNSLMEMGSLCFAYCTNIHNIQFNPNIDFIGDKAFGDCYNLSFINFILFNTTPHWSVKDLFTNNKVENGTILVANEALKDQWRTWLSTEEENNWFDNWFYRVG